MKTRWFDTGERNSFPFSPQTQSLHFPARASGQPGPASPNAVFDETFQLRDYNPISILPISPSVHPKKILETMGAEDARLRTSPSHEFMFHREYIGKLIDFGYEDGLARHDELAEFFAE